MLGARTFEIFDELSHLVEGAHFRLGPLLADGLFLFLEAESRIDESVCQLRDDLPSHLLDERQNVPEDLGDLSNPVFDGDICLFEAGNVLDLNVLYADVVLHGLPLSKAGFKRRLFFSCTTLIPNRKLSIEKGTYVDKGYISL